MRAAIILRFFDSSEVRCVEEISLPEVRPAEWVVRVYAERANPGDLNAVIGTLSRRMFNVGLGDQFDADKIGSVFARPDNTLSYTSWPRSGKYVGQVRAVGRLGLRYLHSRDDRRNHGR